MKMSKMKNSTFLANVENTFFDIFILFIYYLCECYLIKGVIVCMMIQKKSIHQQNLLKLLE